MIHTLVCGEKLNQKLRMQRKNDKYEVCFGLESIYDQAFVWSQQFHNNRKSAMSKDFDIGLKAKATVPKTRDIRTYKEIRMMFKPG